MPDPAPHPLLVTLAVAGGGAAGALLRHFAGVAAVAAGGRTWMATVAVNVAGCLAIGFAWRWLHGAGAGPVARALVVTGGLGAMTTFSTFGLDAAEFLEGRRAGAAAAYVGVTVAAGLVCVRVGQRLADAMLAAD